MPAAAKPMHTCPVIDSSGDHKLSGQQIIPVGQSKVFIEGQPAIVVFDTCVCPTPNMVTGGSGKVFFQNKPAARQGDPTAHGGSIVQGSAKVFIN